MKTHRENVLRKYNLPDEHYSLPELDNKTGFPLSALRQVYEKGLGAYYTNYSSVREKGTYKKGTNAPPSQKLSPQQWGMSRVYAFVDKSPKVFRGADKSIAEAFDLI